MVVFSSTMSNLILIFSFILCVVSIAVLFIIKSKLSPIFFLVFIIASLQILFNSISQAYVAFFRANRNSAIFLIYSLLNTILATGLSILAVYLGYGIMGIIVSNIISSVVVLAIYSAKIRKLFKIKLFKFSKKISKEAIAFGLPLVISALSIWVLSASDRYLIKYFLDNTAVGIYSVPYNITAKSLQLIIGSFVLASTPSLVNVWEKDRKNTSQLLQYLNRLFLILVLPVTVLVSIVSRPLIGLLTPKEFIEGYRIMALVAFGVFFWGYYQLAYTGLYLEKKTWSIAINVFIAGAINIVLNIIMIPRLGIAGAAYATLIAYFYIFTSSIFLVKKYLPWKFPEGASFIKIIFAVLIPIVPIYFILKLNLGNLWLFLISGAIYVAFYTVLLFAFNTIYPAERKVLFSKLKSVFYRAK